MHLSVINRWWINVFVKLKLYFNRKNGWVTALLGKLTRRRPVLNCRDLGANVSIEEKSLVFLLCTWLACRRVSACRCQLATGAFAPLYITFLRNFDVQDNKYRIFFSLDQWKNSNSLEDKLCSWHCNWFFLFIFVFILFTTQKKLLNVRKKIFT